MAPQWRRNWQHASNHEGVMRGAKALLALGCMFAFGWWAGWQEELMAVLLGVNASAFTESDDNWRSRLRMQLLALLLFAALLWLVWAAVPWPGALAALLALAAFGLTLLGVWGERYRVLAFGSLVWLIYVGLVAETSRAQALAAAPLMLAGAAWYGLVSVLWAAAWPEPPVRYRLSRLYAVLGEYLRLKSQLLEPVRGMDLERRRMALALHNGRVVDALNASKDSLLNRLGKGTPPPWLQTAMHQYLAAQDIHERTSSSHGHYDQLAEAFFHTDAMYRCQRVLALLGEQALKFSEAIRQQSTPQHQGATARAIEDMQAAIAHLEQHATPTQQGRPLQALQALGSNLTALAQVFSGALRPPAQGADYSLIDHEPQTLCEAWARIRGQLHRQSPLWRHAVRLSLSLLLGFAVMHATQDPHGYWILLTIAFVSQPHYAATLTRLGQRAVGTVLGLAVGWALIRLFPEPVLQSVFVVAAGALFFGTRQTRYVLATGAVTTLLLLNFHQLGMGQGVIPARLLDTAIGSGIAGLAAWLLLPNWQARQWHRLAAQALKTQAAYLREVVAQYQSGKQDHLRYRIARRDAHNADAALSNALAAMLKEPQRVRRHEVASGRFVLLAHISLNYISALGAHRGDADLGPLDTATLHTATTLATELEQLAQALQQRTDPATLAACPAGAPPDTACPLDSLLCSQLQLAMRLLPELRTQVQTLNAR